MSSSDSPFGNPTNSTGTPYPSSSPFSAPIDFVPPAGSSTPADSAYTPPDSGYASGSSDSGYVSGSSDSGYVSGSSDSGYSPAPDSGPTSGPLDTYSSPSAPTAYPQDSTPTAYPQAYPAQPATPYPASPYPPADPYGTPYPSGGFAQQGYVPPTTGYDYGGYPSPYPTQEYASYPPAPVPYAPVYAPPYVVGYNPTEQNGQGVAALVLGILSLCCLGLFTGILAIVFGAQGRKAADEGRATNRGTATAGMILGIIGTVFVSLGWLWVMANS